MALGGHLPDLHPFVRRFRRRRHRRRQRHPVATCPISPTWVSMRCGSIRGTRRRRSMPATTSPTTATSSRCSARSTTGEAMIDEAHAGRPARAARHRAEPHVRRTPLVPRGTRRRARVGRARPLPLPARQGRRRRAAAERLAVGIRRSGVDPRVANRTASGTSTCSTPGSRTSTGTTTRFEPSSSTSCASGSISVSMASASMWPTVLLKAPGLPDIGSEYKPVTGAPPRPGHPHWDQPGVPDIYRAWREVGDSVRPAARVRRRGVGVVGCQAGRLPRAPTACTPRSTSMSPVPRGMRSNCARRSATRWSAHQLVDAPVTWVLSNHDIDRHVTRYGRDRRRTTRCTVDPMQPSTSPWALAGRAPRSSWSWRSPAPCTSTKVRSSACRKSTTSRNRCWPIPPGNDRGTPVAVATDVECRCRGRQPGRRSGSVRPAPWLPQPDDWSDLSVEAQEADDGSMLHLYRNALHLRRVLPELRANDHSWLDLGDDVIAFTRSDRFACVVNFGDRPVPICPTASC